MRVSVSDDVIARDLAGEAVLLHLGTGTYFGLNAVGTRIWHLLAQHKSTEAVLPLLLQEFDADEQQLRRDLDALVGELLAKQLLVAADNPA